uniref:Uncharacterized protein n=1 Tax=Rhizophagus irregularis (strain DAOM 181602 / DAOM 197198 / MUCL 43194) TaxID=747089 RepID=U9TNV7_RHIID
MGLYYKYCCTFNRISQIPRSYDPGGFVFKATYIVAIIGKAKFSKEQKSYKKV